MLGLRAMLTMLLLAVAAKAGPLPSVRTVFVIVVENHNWSAFAGSADAPFINGTLLPQGAHCEQYYNPPGLHPSEPNYLWLESGTNWGVMDSSDPAINHQNSTNHLVAQLRQAGISWKSYQEDISGAVVPLTATNGYVPRHDPFVFFDDVTGTNDPNDAYGLAHIRPYSELAGDLANHTVAQYNFISPDLCDAGHDTCAPEENPVRQTDDWLAREVPRILSSDAYSNQGVLFITWDESDVGDGPIGMILLSPLARGGYASPLHYTHSSLLRTLQELFGVSPWLGDAANATDLGDLFEPLTLEATGLTAGGAFGLRLSGVVPGGTNIVEASTDLVRWLAISTNSSSSNSLTWQDGMATNHDWQFYRARAEP